jgi:hypothetical protein
MGICSPGILAQARRYHDEMWLQLSTSLLRPKKTAFHIKHERFATIGLLG